MSRAVLHYAPDPHQRDFHAARRTTRYRALLAGTGGGKTYAGLAEALTWMALYPGSVGLIAEPDYKMIERVIIPKLCMLLGVTDLESSPFIRSYHQTFHRIIAANGSVCWLAGMEDPERVEGPDLDWAMVDEGRLVRRWDAAWKTLRRRLRGTGKGYPRGAWVCTHSPTKEIHDFFEGGDPDKQHPSALVYRWPSRANKHVPDDYLDDIERAHTGAAYKAAVLGQYARPEGLVYSDFDPSKHIRPAPPKWDRVSYGVDWGFSQPACLLAIVWLGERAHVVGEYYRTHASLQELVFQAHALQNQWGKGTWWCGHDRPDHISEFRKAGLKARAYQGKVKDGVGILNSMYRGDELHIDAECENVLRENDLYGYPTGDRADKEQPEKGNDHAMDAKRYGVMGGRGTGTKGFGVG